MTGRHSGRLHAACLLLKVCVCCMCTHLPGKKNSAACVCECEPASVVITVYFSVCLYLLHWTALHIWQESADPDLSLQTKVNYPPTSPLWLSERATLRGRRKRKGERARVSFSTHSFCLFGQLCGSPVWSDFLSLWSIWTESTPAATAAQETPLHSEINRRHIKNEGAYVIRRYSRSLVNEACYLSCLCSGCAPAMLRVYSLMPKDAHNNTKSAGTVCEGVKSWKKCTKAL